MHGSILKIYTYISDPIEIRTLWIGDFAAQIENDPGGLIPGTKAEGDQRKILRLVVGGDFFLGGSGKIQFLNSIFFVVFFAPICLTCSIFAATFLDK